MGNTSFVNDSDRISLKIMWADNLCPGRLGTLLLLTMFIFHLFIVLFYLINFKLFCGPIYILLKSYISLRLPPFLGQIVGHYILNKIFIFVVISSLTCKCGIMCFLLGQTYHGLCDLLAFLMKQFLSFIDKVYCFSL